MTPPMQALPIQLSLALNTWLSLNTVSASASSALPGWKPPPDIPPETLARAIRTEAKSQLEGLLEGARRYSAMPYARNLEEPPAIWRKGAVRLLDYSAYCVTPRARPLLLVPSLINRYTILDLTAKRSLARFLAKSGVPCLMVDWGEPGERERQYTCADYVSHVLAPAYDFIAQASGLPPAVAGYCMGGVLALGLAALRPDIPGIALLATPWDFHAPDVERAVLPHALRTRIERLIASEALVSPEQLHLLFTLQDPFAFQRKLRRFAQLPEGSPKVAAFMALEAWVNEGVSMSPRVASECILGWTQENTLACGQWEVEGIPVRPERLRIPAFIAAPKHDRIVPHGCAMALAAALPNANTVTPSSGHVGMIIGHLARKELWEKLCAWHGALQ